MAYADPDAVTQIANGLSTSTFSYDADGNLTQKTVDGTTTTYLWDYANRLIALSSGGATTTYAYDAFGTRVLQTGTTTTSIYPFKWYSVASSTGSGATTTTDYIFDGDTLLATADTPTGSSGSATSSADTGYQVPSSTGSPSNDWLNPQNAYVSDNVYATTTGIGTKSQDYATFNFSVPSGATINGIEVDTEGKTSLSTLAHTIQLSWNGGTTYTSTESNTWTTTEQVWVYGGSADTWGRTWSYTEFSNSNFRVKIAHASSAVTPSLDQIKVKVFYTSTSGGSASTSTVLRYIHPDHLGSTNVVTDQNGNLVQTLDYYPYGATRISVATSTNEQRKYIGQYSDTSGLDYLNARYYNGSQGQFTSEDPVFLSPPSQQNLQDPQSLNAYSYSEDNPITGSDPTGKTIYLTASGVPEAFGLAYHLGYYISPDPGSQFANVGPFSLNGEPQDGSIPHLSWTGLSWGNLVGEVGYAANGTATPLPSNSSMYTQITPPKGETEDELIKELLLGNGAVNNAKVSYWPGGNTPGSINGNSNNDAYTLAQFAGVSGQFSSFSSEFNAPGDKADVPNIVAAHNASLGGGGVSSGGTSIPNQNSWWTTPSGAVVTWGGSLVAAPSSQKK